MDGVINKVMFNIEMVTDRSSAFQRARVENTIIQ